MGDFNLKDRTQAKWSMQKFTVSKEKKVVSAPKQVLDEVIDLSKVMKDIEVAAKAALALFSKPLSSRTPTDLVRKN